jgi:hypothetical protein
MKSPFLSLNTQDYLKGLLVSVLSAILTIVYQTVQSGSLTFDWKAIGTIATTAALGYILKNLMTNSQDQFLKSEAPAVG